MIRLTELTKEEIDTIAEEIADAFMQEEGCFPKSFDMRDCITYYKALIRIIYENGALYTFSEQREGYAAYWLKKDRPAIQQHFKMAYFILKNMPLNRFMVFSKNLKKWKGYEHIYRKEDYVDFFMVAIKPEFQGHGLLRKVLNAAFELAGNNHVKCVLDTDSEIKAKKYQHCGMKLVKEQLLDSGVHMYTLEWRCGEHHV